MCNPVSPALRPARGIRQVLRCSPGLTLCMLLVLALSATCSTVLAALPAAGLESAAPAAPAAGTAGGPDVTGLLSTAAARLGAELAAVAGAARDSGSILRGIAGRVGEGGQAQFWRALGALVLALVAGGLAEWRLRRALLADMADADHATERWRSRFRPALRLGAVRLAGIAAFAIAATVVLVSFGPATASELLATTALFGIVTVRLVGLAAELLFAPQRPHARLVTVDDRLARYAFESVLWIAAILAAYRLTVSLVVAYGAPQAFALLVGLFGSLLLVVAICVILWRARGLFAAGPGAEPGASAGQAGAPRAHRHLLAIVYVVVVWLGAVCVRLATGHEVLLPALVTVMLVVAVPLVDDRLQALAIRLAGRAPADGADSTAGQPYREAMLRNLRLLAIVLGVVLVVRLWGVNVQGVVEQVVGLRLASAAFDTGLAALLAYAVWGLASAGMQRYARPREDASGESGNGGLAATSARLQTLLPLFRKTLAAALVTVVVLTALSSLGVQIGPLLAGAGVVGIAVGFGAQALVRDVISGLFFLLDDAFRMGEYVEIDRTRGTVEKISIRSLQLRHHNGPVHTIPFGQIRFVTNYSREWVMMKFELRIPFETNIDRVRKLIKQVGQEMMDDPELGPQFLEPLKSQGVDRMDDSALIIRCKFMARPGEQFVLRREAFSRIQKAFEKSGIHFAPRRVIVEAASGVTPATAAAAAAAAQPDQQATPG